MEKYGALLDAVDCFVVLAETVYGPYFSGNQNRKLVIIKDDDGTTRTVSYPKYLLEQHLGHKLDENMTVDHIDRDHTNDDLSNLRIVPRQEHSRDDTRRVKLVEFDCSMCGKKFLRSPRLVRDKSRKGRRGIFCTRQCAGRYARKLQLGLIDKFPVQPYIESEYYRNTKNIETDATLMYLMAKYGS